MERNTGPEARWALISERIADMMGLHFPRERWPDLQRGLAGAALEMEFEDLAACADWILSAPLTRAQLQVLAGHLTIGETYFFRESKTFEILAGIVLPDLIRSRRGREQRLRLWSAGCCTGEEAYSLAILLHQLLPDLADWQVTILATDLNERFLQRAVAGSYGEWSFRNAPADLKEQYFERSGDGRCVVIPKVKAMVTFAHLNLVEDGYPSLTTDTNAMDLILCRNVLMYFTAEQTRKVVGKFHRALIDGGCLAVSPSEASQVLFSQFVTLNSPGVILYQKSGAKARSGQTAPSPAVSEGLGYFKQESERSWTPPETAEPHLPPSGNGPPVETEPAPNAVAGALYEQGRYAEAAETLLAAVAGRARDPLTFSLLARALANQGKLAEALTWCDRWIAADKLDPAGHYLRAVVLVEKGDAERARQSLHRAVYLHPDFVLAHFALGNLARRMGRSADADKHFSNALHLLNRLQPDDLLPESDGLTAGRLSETLAALTVMGATR